tara:strand:- start:994 stop:1419 length:426 start_codon:yes stop_codon:yes gene_type:complete
MICPDVNLLLYACFPSFPDHAKAKGWWDGILSSSQRVCLGHVVVLGFIRISTSSRVFDRPISIEDSIEVVDAWLAQPNVEFIGPADGHWEHLRAMLRAAKTGGNLTTDAHIAALAADYGLVVYSNDADFARFPAIKWVNPL